METAQPDLESAAGGQRFEDVHREEDRVRTMLGRPQAEHDAVVIKEIHKVPPRSSTPRAR